MEGKEVGNNATSDARVQHWKTKYLDFLEEHENEQAQHNDLVQVLRRGLLSVSLLGDGLDANLDRKLSTLRELLQKLDSKSAGLDDLVQAIEVDLLSLDSQRNQEAVALKFTLSKSLSELLECESIKRSDYRQPLKRMQKVVRKSLEDPRTQLSHLKEFSALLTALLTNTSASDHLKPESFWQKLTRTLLKNDSSSSHKSASEEAGNPAINETNQAPAADETVLNEINEFISQVLDNLSPVNAVNAVALKLQAQLKTASAEELPGLLQKTLNVINMAHVSEQKQLKDYLNSVHQSLEDLGTFINKSQHHSKQRSAEDRKLDTDLRFNMDSISNHVKNAENLQQLQSSIQGKLDNMISCMNQIRESRQEADTAYSGEIRQLMNKVESMEKESRLLHESVAKQQTAMRLDSLTSLHNRNAYFERIEQEFKVWQATEDQLCLCLADIDFLHKLNENHGHSIGDKAIQLIAQEISTHMRKSDFLARIGGEQFVMILPATSADLALDAMENIREHIGRCKFKCKDATLNITMSFGITEFGEGDSVESVFNRVEHALLEAKNSGRNCCRVNRGH